MNDSPRADDRCLDDDCISLEEEYIGIYDGNVVAPIEDPFAMPISASFDCRRNISWT